MLALADGSADERLAPVDCIFHRCNAIPRDDMTPGLRTHKQATLRVAVPSGLPPEYWEPVREIIGVYSGARRNGHATALMHQVCAEADRATITLMITVKPFADEMNGDQLKRWYGRFGFIEIQAEPCLMARSPQQSRIVRAH